MLLLRLNKPAVHLDSADIDSISSLHMNMLEIVTRDGKIYYGYYLKQ